MINILGVDIDNNLNREELFLKINDFLDSDKQNYIVTPNPEIILKASKDEELFYILNKADLSLADGFGLKIAAFLNGKKLNRFTGADTILDIFEIAQNRKKKVLIINNKNGLSSSSEISIALTNRYPGLEFLIEDCDLSYNIDNQPKELINFNWQKNNFFTRFAKKIEKKINDKLEFLVHNKLLEFEPDILICNFGAPYQEKFIWHNFKKIPSIKLAIGIGGALDFLTGKIKRAPKIMRRMGLEWLWRFFRQPWRYKRMYQAVLVFAWKFFYWKFISPLFYRKNVACILYRKFNIPYIALENKTRDPLENYQILLVERSEEPGHWQLPQGGIESDKIKLAGSRELYEELGVTNFTPKKIYKNLFKYRANRKGRYGFKGQQQSLLLAEFKGDDSDIKINYWDHSDWKWVKATDLVNEVHLLRRKGAEIFFAKFKEYILGKK